MLACVEVVVDVGQGATEGTHVDVEVPVALVVMSEVEVLFATDVVLHALARLQDEVVNANAFRAWSPGCPATARARLRMNTTEKNATLRWRYELGLAPI